VLFTALIGVASAAPLTSSSSQTAPGALPAANLPPTITKQPVSTAVEEGHSATFEATASGSPTPTIKWERSINGGSTWTAVAGGTSTVLTLPSLKLTESGRLYRATFTNVAGKATTEVATLTVGKTPSVTGQPSSQIGIEGKPVFFSASAGGSPEPSVQWEVSTNGGATFTAIPGATFSPYIIASAKLAQSGSEYRAVFTNVLGKATSNAATLTVYGLPQITQLPQSLTVEEGQSASFESTATATPSPTIKWERSTDNGTTWTLVSGATSNTLTVTNTKTTEDGNEYRSAFTNVAGTVTSAPATLTVHKAPAITKQPGPAVVNEGQTATFEAAASGYPAPSAQWEVSSDGGATWAQIPGATSAVLTVPAATFSENGNQYRAVFTNVAGSATTAGASLTVHSPPVITSQPSSTIVQAGEGVTFESTATGFPSPTVQWEVSTNAGVSWSTIPGATSTTFTIAVTTLAENKNQYRAVFTNVAGTRDSQPATLTVATNHYAAIGWGKNTSLQLGNGSNQAYSAAPSAVTGLKFVTQIAAGGRHSLAVIANETVLAWGSNEFVQLGQEGATSGVPTLIKGLTGVKSVAAGANHSLALLSNGTVMAWGENEYGQLGDGGTSESSVPVPVKGLSGVRAISAGATFSLALLSNGTVMAWGNNEVGQLGTGKAGNETSPAAVKGLKGVTAISAGGDFALALLSDGTVQSWGSNEFGQLGTEEAEGAEEESGSNVPVPVGSLSGVAQIAAGTNHALALLTSGTVMAWGEDTYGELGNGAVKPRQQAPVAVTGLSGVSAVSAGGQDSVARLTNGSVMTWGINVWGTLGDGVAGAPSDVPVTVNGLSQAADVSAGGSHMLAYGEAIPTVTSVSPKEGSTAGGTTVTITGVNLLGAGAVKFGTTPATSFTVESATSIKATAPAGAGTVDITVTTESGTSPGGAADRFTYKVPPTVTKLSPVTGPASGGTVVTITGAEFAGVTGVTFGGAPASEYTVISPTSITAVAPASASGYADVRVSAVGGTSPTTAKDRFKYVPTVTSVSPNAGPVAGGTSVTVTGSGFTVGTETMFKFGKVKATAVSCTSSTSCTMLSPAGLAGAVDVTALVGRLASLASPADLFTYS
jgi:alpha-tubulin suppressor-like RCC1 family protein